MNPEAQPLLTVGIPTWNRSGFLRETIGSVTEQAVAAGLADAVEILVSDNASTDDTAAVVAALQATTSVRIRYHCNPTNLGAVPNILKTLELSQGQYWMVYGDDDLMAKNALPQILTAFHHHPEGVVFMFQQDPPSPLMDIQQVRALSVVEAARDYFYYLGNAGVFALRTAEARTVLIEAGADSYRTCWPQTQIAFEAMARSGIEAPVVAMPIRSSSSPHHLDNTIYTAWYLWETTFFALYRTARALRPTLGPRFFEAACSHLFAPRRIAALARQVLYHTAFLDLPQDVAEFRTATRRSLRLARGPARLPLWLFRTLAVLPRPVKMLSLPLQFISRPAHWGVRWQRWRADIQARRERRAGGPPKTNPKRIYTHQDF
jgi:glycosyltransferase involved in cell wall biosynthesis